MVKPAYILESFRKISLLNFNYFTQFVQSIVASLVNISNFDVGLMRCLG